MLRWRILLTWLRENWKYLVVVAFSVTIVLLAVHDLYTSAASSRQQSVINYMSAEAFQAWLYEMEDIKTILENAETNLDVKEATNYTSATVQFANILEWNIEVFPRPPDFTEHLYLHMAGATVMLDYAVSAVATEPPTTERTLDNETLQKFQNLTITIGSLVDSVGEIEDGVDPVQQLKERGVLNQVITYVDQMKETSIDIWGMHD